MSIASQVNVLESIVSKIDTSIEKLTEVSNSVSKLLAVHDSRLDYLEKYAEQKDSDVKELHFRITTTTKEVCDKIDYLESIIERKMAENAASAAEQHQEIQLQIKEDLKILGARITILEQWRWYILGGAAVLGYLMSTIVKII